MKYYYNFYNIKILCALHNSLSNNYDKVSDINMNSISRYIRAFLDRLVLVRVCVTISTRGECVCVCVCG